ncbi:MAG: NAD(P)-binding protein [Microscillaceae bacterium]|nr:NAD(P)-binding protein [Microscillaceae bacterium]
MVKNATVIGAGIAGMATAIRLANMGFKVEVFESASTYGGKVKEHRWNGFRSKEPKAKQSRPPKT